MPNKQYFETRICPRCKRDYFLIEKNMCAACGYPKSNTLWYLAHPYSAKRPGPEWGIPEEEQNFNNVNFLANQLIRRGMKIYSPISHTHPIHEAGPPISKEQEYEIYMPLDKTIAMRCDGLILCEGWKQSRGCLIERNWFLGWEKPIKYLSRHANFISRDVTRGDEHE